MTLRVVRGSPDDEELAAAVAALGVVAARLARPSINAAARPFAVSAWRAALLNRGGHSVRKVGGWRAMGTLQR